jgi:hypothetical protein
MLPFCNRLVQADATFNSRASDLRGGAGGNAASLPDQLNDFPPFENRKTLIFKVSVMAEGVVSEPFLPSGDQGRKGGFATLPKPSVIG